MEVSPEFSRLLHQARILLWWEESRAILVRLAIVGLAISLLGSLVEAFLPTLVPPGVFWAVAAAVVLRGVVVAILARPTPWRAARVLDKRLGLRQRLATAMELTARGSPGPLDAAQVAEAKAIARQIRVHQAFPTRWQWSEFRLLAALAVGVVGLSLATSFLDLRLADLSNGRRAQEEGMRRLAELSRQIDESSMGNAASNRQDVSLNKQLAALLQQAANRQADAGETNVQLAAAHAEVSQHLSDSFRTEQALNVLAQAWKDGSATRQAAENLERGQYEQAAEEMEKLAQELQQLSPQARSEMARGLQQAAQNSQSLDADLSRAMQQASQALGKRNQEAARQALNQLAQKTDEAGQSLANREQLNQALGQMDQAMQSLAQAEGQNPEGQPSDQQQPGFGAGLGAGSQTDEGQNGLSSSSSQGAIPDNQRQQQQMLSALSQQKVGQMGSGSNRGSQDKLDSQGETVKVKPQQLDGPMLTDEQEVFDPKARGVIGTGAGTGELNAGISGRIQASPDSTRIPWLAKPFVRDYFSSLEVRKP